MDYSFITDKYSKAIGCGGLEMLRNRNIIKELEIDEEKGRVAFSFYIVDIDKDTRVRMEIRNKADDQCIEYRLNEEGYSYKIPYADVENDAMVYKHVMQMVEQLRALIKIKGYRLLDSLQRNIQSNAEIVYIVNGTIKGSKKGSKQRIAVVLTDKKGKVKVGIYRITNGEYGLSKRAIRVFEVYDLLFKEDMKRVVADIQTVITNMSGKGV